MCVRLSKIAPNIRAVCVSNGLQWPSVDVSLRTAKSSFDAVDGSSTGT